MGATQDTNPGSPISWKDFPCDYGPEVIFHKVLWVFAPAINWP